MDSSGCASVLNAFGPPVPRALTVSLVVWKHVCLYLRGQQCEENVKEPISIAISLKIQLFNIFFK